MQKKSSRAEHPGRADHKDTLIKIVTKEKPLNKIQQTFNRLTEKISQLKAAIEETDSKLLELQKVYNKEVKPEVEKLGQAKIRMAHLLHEKRGNTKPKLTKITKNKLDELILDLLDDAFYVVNPSDKDKELYSQYNNTSFEEEEQRQKSDMLSMFSDMIYQQTGLRIDTSTLDDEKLDFEKIKHQFQEQINEKNKKKKTKKQAEKELKEQQKEVLKQKSLRSIYLSLAKILHPDTETDVKIKAEKEEYMKMITTAYNDKNLLQLLELEIQWVHGHKNQLTETPEDILKLYNELLKEQSKSLEIELFSIMQNPAYNEVAELGDRSIKAATNILKNEKKSYIATHKSYANYNIELEHAENAFRIIIDCIDAFREVDNDPFQEAIFEFMQRQNKF